MFIPRSLKESRRPCSHAHCQWCCAVDKRRSMYKIRDGPVDWWFCNDEHALEWLSWRHRNPVMHAALKTGPRQRRALLGALSIEQYAERSLDLPKTQ